MHSLQPCAVVQTATASAPGVPPTGCQRFPLTVGDLKVYLEVAQSTDSPTKTAECWLSQPAMEWEAFTRKPIKF